MASLLLASLHTDGAGSFTKLQRLARSLTDDRLTTAGQRAMLRLAGQLGPLAVPVCLRALRAGTAPAADRAATVLTWLGQSESAGPKIIAALHAELEARGAASDRAWRILHALGAVPAARIEESAEDIAPEALTATSVRELCDLLESAPGVAKARELMAEVFDPGDALDIAEMMLTTSPAHARVLLDALLPDARDGALDGELRVQLERMRAELQVADADAARNGGAAAPDWTTVRARALDLLAAGEAARAAWLMSRHVDQVPGQPDTLGELGVSLLAAGQAAGAHRALSRATSLAPERAVLQWNLAAAAHAEGRAGACYLALCGWLEALEAGPDDACHPAPAEQRALAQRYLADYQRLARLEHPEVEVTAVARADEHVHRGRLRLEQARSADAILAFERAVQLVPTHAQAWTLLARALRRSGRLDAAEAAVARARTLRPASPEALAEQRAIAHQRSAVRPRPRSSTARSRGRQRDLGPARAPATPSRE